MSSQEEINELAINGGKPAKTDKPRYMAPGGWFLDEAEEAQVLDVLHRRRLFRYYGVDEGLSKVDQLEKEFAAFFGARHALAVNAGTSALICGLQGIGIGPGDEVIVPAYTWIASATAVLAAGGIPVVAEVNETLTLDAGDVEQRLSNNTKAIMPVHIRGINCQMDKLMALAEKHNLKVIEDSCQADGASFQGKRLGTIGDVGCYSLQFNKIITAGEGGMMLTNDDEVWKRAVMYHDPVGGTRNEIPTDEVIWGVNFRMPELLGAVMLEQLKKVDTILTAMRERKRMLLEGIADITRKKGIRVHQAPDPDGEGAVALIFFMDDAESANRIASALQAENLPVSTLYHPDRPDYHIFSHWTPIVNKRSWSPENSPWRWAQREISYTPDQCPRTLDLLGRAVHMDVHPVLTNNEVEETIDGLNKVLNVLA